MSAHRNAEVSLRFGSRAKKPSGSRGLGLLPLGVTLVVVVSSAVFSVDRYPDLRVRAPFRACVSRNQGNRSFGYHALNFLGDPRGKTHTELCFDQGQAFGDVNGDGRLDEINETGVYLGHGDGVFGPLTVEFVNQNSPMAIASADLDKDGYADVLIGTLGIKVFFGGPDGTLRGGEEVLPFVCGDVPAVLKLVDIDQDGFEDVLGTSNAGPLLAFGRGDGTFELSDQYVGSARRAKLADFNGDGLLDLVTTARIELLPAKPFDGYIALCVSFGQGRGFLEPRTEIPIQGMDYWKDFPAGVATGDFDRDGFVDVATGGRLGKLAIFLGNGDGTFQPQIDEPLPVSDYPTALLFCDLDLDGLGDLVVGYWRAWMQIYWGEEDGFVDYAHPTEIRASYVIDIETITGLWRGFIRGDANDDSKVDISDAVTILGQLFGGWDMICGDASDANDDGDVDLTDALYLALHLFRGGPPPPHPYPEAGGDMVDDPGWGAGHYGGDLGCSYETFNYEPRYVPCQGVGDPALCAPNPAPLQYIDVGLPNPYEDG